MNWTGIDDVGGLVTESLAIYDENVMHVSFGKLHKWDLLMGSVYNSILKEIRCSIEPPVQK